jgi:hypothetical protein
MQTVSQSSESSLYIRFSRRLGAASGWPRKSLSELPFLHCWSSMKWPGDTQAELSDARAITGAYGRLAVACVACMHYLIYPRKRMQSKCNIGLDLIGVLQLI